MRGAIPWTWGIDPAHVVGFTMFSPVVSCERKLPFDSGDISLAPRAARPRAGSPRLRIMCSSQVSEPLT
jgi:hypothetical protein